LQIFSLVSIDSTTEWTDPDFPHDQRSIFFGSSSGGSSKRGSKQMDWRRFYAAVALASPENDADGYCLKDPLITGALGNNVSM
jgi:hypothetical protein